VSESTWGGNGDVLGFELRASYLSRLSTTESNGLT
jgi:hypothetical protein